LLHEARATLMSVRELTEIAAANDPGNVTALLAFGHVNQQLCHCLVQLGRHEEASSVFRRFVAVQKSLHPRQSIEPGAADDFWREVAKTVLTMWTVWGAKQTSFPEDILRATLSEMHFQPQSEGHLGWCVILAEGDLAARMRRTGQNADAKEQVTQMIDYGRALVARCPNDPLAYLALSEAQIHFAKNAIRYEPAKRETALRQALDSAERAIAIDPANPKAQAAVADRRRRLTQFRADDSSVKVGMARSVAGDDRDRAVTPDPR
jgi:hypothetical protein